MPSRPDRIAEIEPAEGTRRLSDRSTSTHGPSVARRAVHGAVAGAAAAGIWLAAEPLIARLTRLDYSEVQLLGGLVADGERAELVGSAVHLVNGALFGTGFGVAAGEGAGTGTIAALVENTVLWPAFVVIDRIHPKRKRGEWPRLWSDPRIIAHELIGHAVFGASLGTLQRWLNVRSRQQTSSARHRGPR